MVSAVLDEGAGVLQALSWKQSMEICERERVPGAGSLHFEWLIHASLIRSDLGFSISRELYTLWKRWRELPRSLLGDGEVCKRNPIRRLRSISFKELT